MMTLALRGARDTAHAKRAFIAIAALLFVASVAATVALRVSMSSMPDLPMPGGWMLSMTWTRACGRTWLREAASFAFMWIAMMTVMMLPSFAPALWRVERKRVSFVAGYAVVWGAAGVVIYLLGMAFAALVLGSSMFARAVPFLSGLVIFSAGIDEFRLTNVVGLKHFLPHSFAWLSGVRYGFDCVQGCAGLMAALLAFGMMDLRAMAFATIAITARRLLPEALSISRVTGVVLIATGFLSIANALP